MLSRDQLIEHLTHALRASDVIHAAWLGGSDATGRTDRYSDIDLMCIADDDRIADVFELVHNALEERSPIEHEWRVPEPTWHGHSQVFYRLRDTEPWLLIDLCVQKRSCKPAMRFLEPQRHGHAHVLFDRAGLIEEAPPLDQQSHDQAVAMHLEQLRMRAPLFQPMVEKVVRRESLVEAMYFYQAFTMRPLIDLLRIVHCPDRFDFGWRYLQDDLPSDVYSVLETLAFARDADELLAKHQQAVALFERTLATTE